MASPAAPPVSSFLSSAAAAAVAPSHALKCLVLGDPKAGKTSLLSRAVLGTFPDVAVYIPTLLLDEEHKPYSLGIVIDDEAPYSVSVVDTRGDDDYEDWRAQKYAGSDVALICFDVSLGSPALARVESHWLPELKRLLPSGIPFVLAGLKTDLRDEYAVPPKGDSCTTREQGEALMKKLGAAAYVEISSKLNQDMRFLFAVTRAVVDARNKRNPPKSKCQIQ